MRTPKNLSAVQAQMSGEPDLIDKEELRWRMNLPSVRTVEILMRERKIPFIRLGHRTVRFSWAKVQDAISKLECRAISA